ncbi:hypothetical protein PIB30_037162 [Stylosanthes scabra]|uniref:Uncharacterized protein n=1 Tax=Stylosanthes scabra TaxID=79078 RepID=A0ABU6TDB9_9FABA|nr:hypothetical protein [Stylosanthes scabra]
MGRTPRRGSLSMCSESVIQTLGRWGLAPRRIGYDLVKEINKDAKASEAEAFDTLMAQNKALAQQINLLSSKLGTMQLAAANTQIGLYDLCGIQGHSSEVCAAILEQ